MNLNLKVIITILMFFFVYKATAVERFDNSFDPRLKTIWRFIEKGDYKKAWQKLVPNIHKEKRSDYVMHEILKARILHHQGAHILARDILDGIEKDLLKLHPSQKVIIEEFYELSSDIYYQFGEFDFYLKEIDKISAYWKRFMPADSFRLALHHSKIAKYYSALMIRDSAQKYTCSALTIFRKQGNNATDIPIWQIYANHISCLRNNFGFADEITIERKDVYIDTCLHYLNQYWPNDNMDKVRIMQAIATIYLDRCSSNEIWKSQPKESALYYKMLSTKLNDCLIKYEKMTGNKHSYIERANYLLGLAAYYKGDTTLYHKLWLKSLQDNFNADNYSPWSCINWKAYFGLSVFIDRLKFSNNELDNKIQQYAKLKSAEQIYLLLRLQNYISLENPVDDTYNINPFRRLSNMELNIFELTQDSVFYHRAWESSQKAKYNELKRKKLRSDSKPSDKAFITNSIELIKLMRKKNDSLLLKRKGFEEFDVLNADELQTDLIKIYANIENLLINNVFIDPLLSSKIKGKPFYSLQAAKKYAKDKNAALIDELFVDVHHGQSQFIIWHILPDTTWYSRIKVTPYSSDWAIYFYGQVNESTKAQIQNMRSTQWDSISYFLYDKLFAQADQIFSRKKLKRLIVSNEPNNSSLPWEMFSRTKEAKKSDRLINFYSITYQLALQPYFENPIYDEKQNNDRMLISAATLNDTLLDLKTARASAKKLYNSYKSDFISGHYSVNDFLAHSESYNIIQIFTHGEDSKGIYFSDRLMHPSEVSSLKFNAELLSIVSCESSLGHRFRSEGMASMVEAFERAGVPRQIAAHWQIDEQTSSEIMTHFYQYLSKGIDCDEALQLAKIDYLSNNHPKYSTPLYWAGLVLYGEPDGFEFKTSSLIDKFDLNWFFGLLIILSVLFYLFRKFKP
jgi:CHAT domain-containing protein